MIKDILKKVLSLLGYEIKKVSPVSQLPEERPVGDMAGLLEDMKRRGLHCSFIMDVGANQAHWSRMAKNIFTGARFCLIEPQKEMKVSLQAFCDEYQDSFFIETGAGSTNEVRILTIWDDLLGSSFLPAADNNLKQQHKQRAIELKTIDSIIEEQKAEYPQLIKLDIQGFELEALKGAEKTFGHTEVYILEVSLFAFEDNMPQFAEVINFMQSRGYVVYDFPGFLRRPYDGALGQCDVCFVKANGFLHASNRWN